MYTTTGPDVVVSLADGGAAERKGTAGRAAFRPLRPIQTLRKVISGARCITRDELSRRSSAEQPPGNIARVFASFAHFMRANIFR